MTLWRRGEAMRPAPKKAWWAESDSRTWKIFQPIIAHSTQHADTNPRSQQGPRDQKMGGENAPKWHGACRKVRIILA